MVILYNLHHVSFNYIYSEFHKTLLKCKAEKKKYIKRRDLAIFDWPQCLGKVREQNDPALRFGKF